MKNNIGTAAWRRLGTLQLEELEQAAYLSLLGGLFFYLNCQTIMLGHYPPHNMELALRCGLVLLAFRKAYVFGCKGEGKRLLLPGVVCTAFFCSYLKTGYEFLLELALCIFCAIDVPYRRILGVYLAVTVVCVFAGVSGGFMDLVTQLSYRYYRNTVWRHSFGIVYPTDFAAHIVYILLALWTYERKPHSVRMLVLVAAALVLQLKFTDTQCSEIVCVLLIPCILYVVLAEHFSNTRYSKGIESLVNKGLLVAMPLFAAAMITMIALYTQGVPLWDKLNTLLSRRLALGKEGIVNYGISLFGTAFDMIGNGGSIESPAAGTYNFLDCSYILLPIRYGVVVLLALLIIYEVVIRKAVTYKHRRLALSFFLVAVACIIEHHILELAYNPFVLLAFADFQTEEEKANVLPARREQITGGIVWLALAVVTVAVMPWLWSYGKTAVNVLVLGDAENRTVPAQALLFLMIAAACVLLWGGYRLIMCLLNRRKPGKELPLVLAALLFAVGVACCTEYLLGRNMDRYTERLEKSEELVEAIKEEDLPCSIRVEDIPELYRREVEGVENQLLPTYTASTDTDVVIFAASAVDHENYLLESGYTCYQVTDGCIVYINRADASAIMREHGCTQLW